MLFASAMPVELILSALWFLGGAVIYYALIRQISARPPAVPGEGGGFGVAEAILAGFLVLWFCFMVVASVARPSEEITDGVVLASLLVSVGYVALIVLVLKIRGRSIDSLAGFSRISVFRAIITGGILLLFAYPLIALADRLVQKIFHTGGSQQSIVELFNSSQTIGQRVMIIVFAVAVAPVAEEFVFRFFLYGVLKRYFGLAFALVATALLFGAVHGHLPSFVALFVLGSCFTIAYEWSGSILVCMTMHSLFNGLMLTLLAFPDTFKQ